MYPVNGVFPAGLHGIYEVYVAGTRPLLSRPQLRYLAGNAPHLETQLAVLVFSQTWRRFDLLPTGWLTDVLLHVR